jgi:hypothetical protein
MALVGLATRCGTGRSERGLCPRQRGLGEASEGAVAAPSDEMGEHVVMIYGTEPA